MTEEPKGLRIMCIATGDVRTQKHECTSAGQTGRP